MSCKHEWVEITTFGSDGKVFQCDKVFQCEKCDIEKIVRSDLTHLLNKQSELDERIREERDLSWDDPQDELADLCTAMSNEVEELRDLTSWKWWADDTRIDYDEATEELIDVLHFWLSAANLLGMDAGTIMETYLGKNETNHERQDEGY